MSDNIFLKLISEKLEKQEDIKKELKKTIASMLKKNIQKIKKTVWYGKIYTKYGGQAKDVYSLIPNVTLARKEIESQSDFKKWAKRLVKIDVYF